MSRTRLIVLTTFLCLAFDSTTGSVSAQELRWRQDYAAARREATESGKPLLLDFGTEACFWCKKLEATTFRDPKIVKLLADRFIAVKIDADRETRLVQSLGIEAYPTLILLTPDGKVAGRHTGYADAAQLTTLLNKAPAPAPAPVATKPSIDPETQQRRQKEQLDADLATLHRKIAATLER